MAHLYASFADAALAEKAAGALLDYGVRQEDVSLVAHDAYGQTRTTPGADYGTDAAGTAPITGLSTAGLESEAGIGAGGLGTATGIGGLGAVPFGLTGTATGYAEPAPASGRAGVYDTPAADVAPVGSDLNPLDQGGPDSAINQTTHPVDPDAAAKHGISTTTPEDAGEGAIKGTGIGLGVGILATLAALTVPGVGLVLGAGVIASALGATALAAGAGALAGGVTGYLKDQGVPNDMAERYHGTVQGGGAMLSISVPSGSVDQATAEQVLAKYGGTDIGAY